MVTKVDDSSASMYRGAMTEPQTIVTQRSIIERLRQIADKRHDMEAVELCEHIAALFAEHLEGERMLREQGRG